MSETAAAFGFSVDSKEAGGFEPLPNGKYEVIITDVKVREGEKAYNSGSTGLDLTLTVRNDVEQEGAKRKTFDSLIALPTVMFKFQQYSVAIGLENGVRIDTLTEFAKHLLYKPVLVTLGTDSYTPVGGEKTFKNVVKMVAPSAVPYAGGLNGGTDPFAPDGSEVKISDDDLPF